ncbi:MAG: 5-formyltetrahydrofolate cyclo-ligase, partial [Thermodesulfobacteriota bacterium]
IFNKAIQAEKEVYFPRVNGSSLDFHRIHNLEQLQIGKFGVLEPEAHLFKAHIEDIDLFVIPALAFDKSGNRLGYGKGYYDRALVNISDSKKVGLSCNLQILDSVPIDKNDRKVGIIVTEQGIVCF